MTLDAYASLEQLKVYLRLPDSEPEDVDDIRELALEAASRAIDKACSRSFRPAGTVQAARVFTATPSSGAVYASMSPYPYSWITHYEVAIDDTVDTTATVKFDSTGNGDYTISETGFRLAPANNPDKGLPYDRLIFDRGVYPPMYPEAVQVTAIWDWDATPNTIVKATLLQASRFWHRIDAPFGIAGSLELQSEMRLLDRLDPDVALMVRSYKKLWGAV